MDSWIDWIRKKIESWTIWMLRQGAIPKHVAFIMDGNRRFAKKKHWHSHKGHEMGFERLEQTLDWCLSLGVQVVTIYAFSIENFKRPPEEVDALMALAAAKLNEFATHSDIVDKHQIRIRVLGNTALLPVEVRKAAAEAVKATRHHSKAVLNICCPYTARHEIVTAIADVVSATRQDAICVSDIDRQLIGRALFTEDYPDIDILVRTSGEARLSDFMLWQVSNGCLLYFTEALWPEFTFWHMLPILLAFQATGRTDVWSKSMVDGCASDRLDEFYSRLYDSRALEKLYYD